MRAFQCRYLSLRWAWVGPLRRVRCTCASASTTYYPPSTIQHPAQEHIKLWSVADLSPYI